MTEKVVENPRPTWLTVAHAVFKIILLLACLYTFVISLDFMSSAFRLIGGKYASEALQSNVIISNPVAGLMIGVLVTVVVQSSSTSTSIVISMVSASILSVRNAIPIIMGANIGTSITGTLVSLTQAKNKENFRRAFSCSTLNDVFNILSVLLLLPIEIATGYLFYTSNAVVGLMFENYDNTTQNSEIEILNAITKPVSSLVIQLDKSVLNDIAKGSAAENATLIKHDCSKKTSIFNATINVTVVNKEAKTCTFLLEGLDWPEWGVGLLLLFISLSLLCFCLIMMVKILTSIFKGSVALIVQKVVNSDFPGIWSLFNGVVSILIGCGLTIVIQSSSVFISCLVPLVGIGLVDVDRVFPLALGANIGTTITGVLAAFSAPSTTLKESLQISLCHTLFNITGIVIWYPIPFVRKIPISIAKFLGETCGQYRWFAILYLVIVFLVIPVSIFGLSFAGLTAFLCVLVPLIALALLVVVVNVLQTKRPNFLPPVLRTWDFLPVQMRSLAPYDRIFTTYICCCKCSKSRVEPVDDEALESKETMNMETLSEELKEKEKMMQETEAVNNHSNNVIVTNENEKF